MGMIIGNIELDLCDLFEYEVALFLFSVSSDVDSFDFGDSVCSVELRICTDVVFIPGCVVGVFVSGNVTVDIWLVDVVVDILFSAVVENILVLCETGFDVDIFDVVVVRTVTELDVLDSLALVPKN